MDTLLQLWLVILSYWCNDILKQSSRDSMSFLQHVCEVVELMLVAQGNTCSLFSHNT